MYLPNGDCFQTREQQRALVQAAAGLSSLHMTICLADKEIKVKEKPDTDSTGTHLNTFVYFPSLGKSTGSFQKALIFPPENCQVSETSAIETQVVRSSATGRQKQNP